VARRSSKQTRYFFADSVGVRGVKRAVFERDFLDHPANRGKESSLLAMSLIREASGRCDFPWWTTFLSAKSNLPVDAVRSHLERLEKAGLLTVLDDPLSPTGKRALFRGHPLHNEVLRRLSGRRSIQAANPPELLMPS